MDKALLQVFITQLNKLDGKEYLLSTIAYWTAPTLKGMKPSSLMSFSTKGRNLLKGCVIEGIKGGKEEETLRKLKSALDKFI